MSREEEELAVLRKQLARVESIIADFSRDLAPHPEKLFLLDGWKDLREELLSECHRRAKASSSPPSNQSSGASPGWIDDPEDDL